jgi:hypothetical protein|tara:strand:+ start:330 stop:851 length:522 start_codon:yes stop_codon:yes gene_type:complete
MLNALEAPDQIRLPIPTQTAPPEEDSLQYWHPNRFGVRFAPAEFRSELKTLHPDLETTWHPLRERWLVWYRRPRISTGWLLLFVVENSQQQFVPLDARIFAACYEQSGFKWGSGKQYWARIEEEAQRDHADRDATRDQLLEDIGSAQWDHTKIQVSMRGHSSGSKFVTHHAGD